MIYSVQAVVRGNGSLLESDPPSFLKNVCFSFDKKIIGLEEATSPRAVMSNETLFRAQMTAEQIEELARWGKVKINDQYRIQYLTVRQVYRAEELTKFEFVRFQMYGGSNAYVKNEQDAFDWHVPCQLCRRVVWTRKKELQVTGAFKEPFVVTKQHDLLVRSDIAPILAAHGVQTMKLLNRSSYIQCISRCNMRLVADGVHQFFGKTCVNCAVSGFYEDTKIESEGKKTYTERYKYMRELVNVPFKILVAREGRKGSLLMAPQSDGAALPNLNTDINGNDPPYRRDIIGCYAFMSGDLTKSLADQLGWKYLRERIYRPAMVIGEYDEKDEVMHTRCQ